MKNVARSRRIGVSLNGQPETTKRIDFLAGNCDQIGDAISKARKTGLALDEMIVVLGDVRDVVAAAMAADLGIDADALIAESHGGLTIPTLLACVRRSFVHAFATVLAPNVVDAVERSPESGAVWVLAIANGGCLLGKHWPAPDPMAN
jgi:hypothetical protein